MFSFFLSLYFFILFFFSPNEINDIRKNVETFRQNSLTRNNRWNGLESRDIRGRSSIKEEERVPALLRVFRSVGKEEKREDKTNSFTEMRSGKRKGKKMHVGWAIENIYSIIRRICVFTSVSIEIVIKFIANSPPRQ